MQVFVNLIQNAKDAVTDSSNQEKLIIIKTFSINNNKIRIEITDNGVGIITKNITKIFNYGFTTKITGHGFGMHTSALGINAIGGTIKIESEGLGKGTTVTMELPFKKMKKV